MTKKGIMYQLRQFFDEEQIVEQCVRSNPWLEDLIVVVNEKEFILATISVEEIKPLMYTVVGRVDAENIADCINALEAQNESKS